MVKALYLGPPGTYSHQAALQQFACKGDVDFIPAKSISECIQKLETDKSIEYSVVPFENSTNGQVVLSYDLLRDLMLHEESMDCDLEGHRVIPKLEVVGEQYVSITHCLIAAEPREKDVSDFSKIKIYSHPQVWGQVCDYLQELGSKFPRTTFEKIDTSSTAEAVKHLLDPQDDTSVLKLAIAGETAANLHNCFIMEKSINDMKENTTRFLVLSRRTNLQIKSQLSQVALMTFTIKEDDPGSLVNVLMILKTHGINMCSINSRPYNEGMRKWRYVFFIEYYYQREGHDWYRFYDELNNLCSKWCLWGIFPRNSNYYS